MKKLLTILILTTASSVVMANEFTKGFHRPDGAFVTGRSQAGETPVPRLTDDFRDNEDLTDTTSLSSTVEGNTTGGVLGRIGSRDPRLLRNGDALEQIIELENGEDGIARGDSLYARKRAANEYGERRTPNLLRRYDVTNPPYSFGNSSYRSNNNELSVYREMFDGRRR